MGEVVQKPATEYMSALRVIDVKTKLDEANAAFAQAQLDGAPVDELRRLRLEADGWQQYYDEANPLDKETGKRWFEETKARETIKNVQDAGTEMTQAIVTFAQEYADFNYHMIAFARDTAMISPESAAIMQSMSYIPFYKDQGWDNANPMQTDQG